MRKLFSWWTDGPLAAGTLLTVATVLCFAPDQFLFMVARAFLWQWCIAFLVVAAWNLPGRRWWSVSAALLSALLTAWPPVSVTMAARPVANKGPVLRVAQMNLLQPNNDHAEVIAAALASDADVISFQEVDPRWAVVLKEGLQHAYPHHRALSDVNCYGIALFSRLPFEEATVRYLHERPMVDAVVRSAEGPVRVLGVHTSSPGDYDAFKERNIQLNTLAALLRSRTMPTVVIGDLNTVSWDRAFRSLCRKAGLHEHPDGTRATWPSIAGMALIPLDHVLVSDHLAVADQHTFPISGSDHRGLLANIHLQ